MSQGESQFIVDEEAWEQRWSGMPALARENALLELGKGRAASDPRFAPFAYQVALQQRRNLMLFVLPGSGMAVGLAMLVNWALGVPFGVALLIGAALAVPLLGGMASVMLYRSRAAIERNAAVLRGMDPPEANARYPQGTWLRAAAVAGRVLTAFLIATLTVRALVWTAWAGIQVSGVDVAISDSARRVALVVWMPVAVALTWLVYRALWARDSDD